MSHMEQGANVLQVSQKHKKVKSEGQVQKGNRHTASTHKTKGYAPGKIKSLQQAGVGGTSEQSRGVVLCGGCSTETC